MKCFYCTAAPSGPPVHFSIEEVLSRSITLKWEYPLEDDRNGIISGFRVHLIESVSGTYTAIDVENTTVTIGDVKPYTLYYAEVVAFTMVGRGPYTERVSVFTLEDGETIDLIPILLNVYFVLKIVPSINNTLY